MILLGVEHGTTSIRFSVDADGSIETLVFSRDDIARGRVDFWKRILEIGGEPDISVLTYSMGDGISEITHVSRCGDSLGLRTRIAGIYTGAGRIVVEEIARRCRETYLVPGVHRKTPTLREIFREAYSHIASADKTALAIYFVREFDLGKGSRAILLDVSSSSVSLLLEDGLITGGLDAPILSLGAIYGPLDMEAIYRIHIGELDPMRAFSSSGAAKIAGASDGRELLARAAGGDARALLAIEAIVETSCMSAGALRAVMDGDPDLIGLAGSIAIARKPLDVFEMFSKKLAWLSRKIVALPENAPSLGCIEIARAIARGCREICGLRILRSLEESM